MFSSSVKATESWSATPENGLWTTKQNQQKKLIFQSKKEELETCSKEDPILQLHEPTLKDFAAKNGITKNVFLISEEEICNYG